MVDKYRPRFINCQSKYTDIKRQNYEDINWFIFLGKEQLRVQPEDKEKTEKATDNYHFNKFRQQMRRWQQVNCVEHIILVNPLPDDKILDWSKLKQIANDILKCI